MTEGTGAGSRDGRDDEDAVDVGCDGAGAASAGDAAFEHRAARVDLDDAPELAAGLGLERHDVAGHHLEPLLLHAAAQHRPQLLAPSQHPDRRAVTPEDRAAAAAHQGLGAAAIASSRAAFTSKSDHASRRSLASPGVAPVVSTGVST